MRALLPLLVACGGGSSSPDAAPDAPASPHYVLDFTFGTNGEALVNTGASSLTSVSLVKTASGLGVLAAQPDDSYVCLTTSSGHVNGACMEGIGLDVMDAHTFAADGGGVVAIDNSGKLVHFGPMPTSVAALPFAASRVFARDDGTLLAFDAAATAVIVGQTTTSDLGVDLDGSQTVLDVTRGPALVAVGTTVGSMNAFVVEAPGLVVDAQYGSGFNTAMEPAAIAIDASAQLVSTAAGIIHILPDGAVDTAYGLALPQLHPDAAYGGDGELLLVQGFAVIRADVHGAAQLTLDPFPDDGHQPSAFSAVLGTDDGGFIVAGVKGSGVVMYHYVPQ